MIIKAESRPVTIYNPLKQEVVGIFLSASVAARYLFPGLQNNLRYGRIHYCLKHKSRLMTLRLDQEVALRWANEAQIEKLADNRYVLTDGYPIPNKKEMEGFNETRMSLKETAERSSKRGAKRLAAA